MRIKHVVLFLSVTISLATIVYNMYIETAITMLLASAAAYVIARKKAKTEDDAPRILVPLIILYFTVAIVMITIITARLVQVLTADKTLLLMAALITITVLSIHIEDGYDEVYNAVFGKLGDSYNERRIVYFGRHDVYIITFEDDGIVVESIIKRYRKKMSLGEFELFKKSEEVWKAFS